MGVAGAIGTALWVALTANWWVFLVVAILVTGLILYIMFVRESGHGERTDIDKHDARRRKRPRMDIPSIDFGQPFVRSSEHIDPSGNPVSEPPLSQHEQGEQWKDTPDHQHRQTGTGSG